MILHAFTDGASRGNPGDSGLGVIVKNERGEVILSLNGYIGTATNNVAEYTALVTLLKRMADAGCTRLVVHSDSELLVRQMNGTYRVKDATLRKHYRQAKKLIEALPFEVEVRHIPREKNRDADRLANVGIDSRKRLRGMRSGRG